MIDSAKKYHIRTSYDRHKMTPHSLDWANQPSFYKAYPATDPTLLPGDIPFPEGKLSSLLKKAVGQGAVPGMVLQNLSLILKLAYSLTAKSRHSNTDFYYRSAASAGALYPTEIYPVAHAVDGLDEGLYHFAIHNHGLCLLRAQNLLPITTKIAPVRGDRAPLLSFFMTAIFFRSAWKYRERAYRYHLLDTGHVVENLILALKIVHSPFNLSYDFDDGKVNQLLGVEETKEAALAVAHVPGEDSMPVGSEKEIGELPDEMKMASRVAPREIPYRTIKEIHGAGTSMISETHPGPTMIHEPGVSPKSWTKIAPPAVWPEIMGHSEAFMKRRSRRNFVETPLDTDVLMALLDSLCVQESSETTGELRYDQSICPGFIVGPVEGMVPGFYLLDMFSASIGLIRSGFFMDKIAHICLDQAWLAHAAVHFVFLANLDFIDRTWGARGYRYAMLTAGRLGERLYLAATAMGIGCCGIGAFYDGEAAALLGLKEETKLLYLVALGPVKRT